MSDNITPERLATINEIRDLSLIGLHQLRKASGQAFSSVGLTYVQAMLLLAIERGHTSPNDLVKHLNIVASALAATVTTLIESGFLERQQVESDARRVVFTLTSNGDGACRSLKKAWQDSYPVDLDSFSDEELKVLTRAAQIVTMRELT